MNEINRQIDRAHRRIALSLFVKALGVCLFAGLSVAAIGLAIPKIWHLSFLSDAADEQLWQTGWLGGGIVIGLISAVVWTVLNRSDRLSSAVEVDRRFQLKERLSSALTLSSQERETEVGQALIHDANDRAETIDVPSEFGFGMGRQLLLPLLPALIMVALVFVPNAAAEAAPEKPAERPKSEVKVAVEEARKKLKKKIEEMEAKGLKDAAANLKSLEKKVDNLSEGLKDDDKREALVKLNNVKKELEKRQQQIGGDAKEMKKQMSQLKRVNDGPAKKLSEAINEGDFKDAQQAIKDLLKDLKSGKLSEAEKRKLAKDLNEIAKELKKMAERHQAEKEKLKERIKKATEKGDLEKAAQLQNKLEKMEQRDKQMQQIKKMAEKMKGCSDCMKNGGGQPKQGQNGQPQDGQGQQPSDAQMQEAADALEDMQDLMEQMEGDMSELQDLEDMMEQIEAAKSDCNGCEGNGQGDKPGWRDWAKGSGRGGGKRDKQETETGSYKSRVKGKLQRGETIVSGHADGKNITGKSISEAREIARSSMSKKSDPLENQKLPRSQRDHAREYFNNLRGN